jgi:large subunit ribosomal protein L3
MGGDRVTVKGLRVVKVLVEKHLLLVSGAVPGPRGGLVAVSKAG